MTTHISLKGGFRKTPHGGQEVGKLKDSMTASLSLRNCQPDHVIDNRIAAIKHGREGFISPKDLPKWFGAADQDLDTVTSELKLRGFSVQQEWADQCFGIVRLKGEVGQFESLFGVQMMNYELDGKIFRAPKLKGQATSVMVPSQFAGIVQSVHRLDKSPVANPFYVLNKFVQRSLAHKAAAKPHSFAALYPAEIYKLQGVPVDQLWQGPGIASFYLSLGGDNGKSIRNALAFVAGQLGMSVPEYIAEAVAGASVDGDPSDGATVENILDAIAQGALPGTIVGLSAGNTDDDFCSGIEFGLSYTKVDLKGGSVSWGSRWDNFPAATLTGRWPKASKAATLVNRPVFLASGDDGATDIRQAVAQKGKHTVVKPRAGKDQYGTDAPGCIIVDGGNFIGVGGVELKGSASAITGRGMWSTNGAAGCGVGPFPQTNNERQLGVAFKSANPGHKVGNGCPMVTDNAAPPSGPKVPIPNADASSFDPQQVGGTSNAAPATCKKWLFALRNQKQGSAVDFLYAHAGTSVFIRTSGSIGPYTADPNAKVDDCQGLGEINYPAASEAASR